MVRKVKATPRRHRCGYNRTICPHTLPLEHALHETVNGLWGILSNDDEEKGEAGTKKLFLQFLAEAFCVMRLMLLELWLEFFHDHAWRAMAKLHVSRLSATVSFLWRHSSTQRKRIQMAGSLGTRSLHGLL